MSTFSHTPTAHILEKKLIEFLADQELHCVAHFSSPEEKKLVHQSFTWAKLFVTQYLHSRQQRAAESISPEAITARELAQQYIGVGNHDFFATCIDGRTMPLVMFSRPPHIGGVLRAPAGILQGFMRGTQPKTVYIDHQSPIISSLKKLLLDKSGDTVFYGFDSHYACAARQQIHDRRGGHEEDGGLRSDVMSKMMMAQGILELRSELVAQGQQPAELIPTFFSFDPHSGYVTAGLEIHVDDHNVASSGFTSEVLDNLEAQHKIVRTESICINPQVLGELERLLVPKSADFRRHFPTSLVKNWQVITELYAQGTGVAYVYILDQLQKVYLNSGWKLDSEDNLQKKNISTRTLRQKAKFLLKNIVTRYSLAGVEPAWPFEHHNEDLVVITEGGYAPFPSLDAFAVFSQDLDALLPNTQLAIELIRTFRAKGQVTDSTHTFTQAAEFKSAPVFVSNKAILRFGDHSIWEQLQHLKLDDVFAQIDWDSAEVLNWDRSAILRQLNKISNIESVAFNLPLASALVDAVYELFHRMRLMMRNKVFREMILRGEIIVLNTIVDRNRQPRLILPLVV